MSLNINEIFYSIQCEGINTGIPAIFIRLSGCNMNCFFCDTEYKKFKKYSVNELKQEIKKYKCNNIIWTGGEPTLQLTDEILSSFDNYYNCIETNGTNPVPSKINYISCSPKVDNKTLKKNFPNGVNEFRFSISKKIPDISRLPKADNYLVSPIFTGTNNNELNKNYLDNCIEFIKNNNQWRLSVQIHKLLKIQ